MNFKRNQTKSATRMRDNDSEIVREQLTLKKLNSIFFVQTKTELKRKPKTGEPNANANAARASDELPRQRQRTETRDQRPETETDTQPEPALTSTCGKDLMSVQRWE